MTTQIEVCTNDEWLTSDLIEDECFQQEVALVRFTTITDILERHGIEWDRPAPNRQSYHGWNGAHFVWRCGAIGCWEKPSPEIEEILIAADEAGIEAAMKAARQLEESL